MTDWPIKKRPSVVIVLSQPLAIEWTPIPDSPLVESSDVGTTNIAQQKILVSGIGQGPHQQRDTLLHEILHACVRLTGHRTSFPSRQTEERVIYALATSLLAVLRDNPELVTWLMEDVP